MPTVNLWKAKHPKFAFWNVKLEATGFGYSTFGGTTTDAWAVNPEAVAEMMDEPMPVGVSAPVLSTVATAGFELCHTAVGPNWPIFVIPVPACSRDAIGTAPTCDVEFKAVVQHVFLIGPAAPSACRLFG